MYNLLVVDDEDIIRKGIIDVVESNIPSFKPIAACNGLEALAIINSMNIDAMILDIMMPKLDGSGLLKILSEKEKRIKILILSGYDDFEYAKTAIEYGAVNYILKPIVPKKIIKYIKELEEELEKERRESEELDKLKSQLQENMSLFKERFFNDIISKRIDTSDFSDRVKFLNLNICGPEYQIAIIDVNKYFYYNNEEKRQLINYSIHKYLESDIPKIGITEYFQINSNQFIVIFNIEPNKPFDTSSALFKLKKRIESKFNVSTSVGLSNKYDRFQDIRRAYFEASNSVKYGALLGREDIVSISDLDNTGASLDYLFDFDDYLVKLKLSDISEIKSQLNDIFDRIDSGGGVRFDLENFNLFCMKVVIYTLVALKEINIEIRSIDLNELAVLTEIYNSKSWIDVRNSIYALIDKVSQYIEENRVKKKMVVIEKVKNIINDNFSNDIYVKFIAEKLYLNPTYLGQLFKTETGMSINEYINRVRINKAKTMLKGSDLMVYEIAEKVGFSDSQYFSTVFKKVIGVTPKEYKEI